MKFLWFAFSYLTLLSASSLSLAVHADSSCNPSYEIKYSSCVTPESHTVIRNVTTDWILVNKGAVRITDGPCLEHIQVMAQENPKASNIKFVQLDDRPAPLRGWGKRDIYCKFTMDEPVLQPVESPTCGIKGVERQGCANHLNIEFVQRCLNASTSTDEDLWKKAACLIDSYADAPHINRLDSETFEELGFHLNMMKKHLANSSTENERRLSAYVNDNFKEQDVD